MKNIFRLFTVMVAASTMMMFASCNKNDDTNTDGDSTTTEYTITVNSNDATLGNVSISPLQATYKAGDQVTITATPNDNANFISWNGTITDNPYTFTVSGNATYTATFEAKPTAAYNATLDGTALDMAGWHDAQTADGIWLFQAAKQAEGNSVYFPYLISYFQGTSTTDMAIATSISCCVELYNEAYYTIDDATYGDWQLFSANNVNCTLCDMTNYTLSLTMSATMYNLGELYNGTVSSSAEATHKTLALTMSNMPFELYTGKAMHKMQIRK